MKSQDEFYFFAAVKEPRSFWRRSEGRRRRKAEYLSFHKLTEEQESSILLLKQMLGCARQTWKRAKRGGEWNVGMKSGRRRSCVILACS